jgi:glycosyltransferase involved in cell wall biosynthesis
MADRVHVCNVDPDPFQWYSVADLFVLPSDVESLPRSMLEAMAFGVPVAMSDAWGVPEVITDGVNGLLFGASSVGEVERCLRRFLEMSAREREKIGDAGRQTVAAKYDSIHYVRRYAELLTEMTTGEAQTAAS